MAEVLLVSLALAIGQKAARAVTGLPQSVVQPDASPPEALAIGAAVGVVLFISASLWMVRAELEYFRLVQTVRKVRLPFVDKERYDQFVEDPVRFPRDAIENTVTGWSLVWWVQPEPELERARKRVVFRIWVMIATMVATMVGLFVLALLTS